MVRIGLLDKTQKKLDYVLGLTVTQFLERRLQTIVSKSQLARSIHEARCLIFQKKIVLNKGHGMRRIVSIPSFIVRKENEASIDKITETKEHTRTKARLQRRKDEKAAAGNADEE